MRTMAEAHGAERTHREVRRRWPQTLLASMVAALLVTSVAAAGASPLEATRHAPGTPVRAEIPGSVPGGLNQAVDLGAAPADAAVSVEVLIAGSDPAGEAGYALAETDPRSPYYRHFLTPQQFDDRFGARPDRVDHARSWLRSAGFTVDVPATPSSYVAGHGTVAAADKAFAVRLHRFRWGSRTFIANATAASAPADLDVSAVVGLNDIAHAHIASAPAPVASVLNGRTIRPADLWNIYRQPSDNQGQDERVAVLGWGDVQGTLRNLSAYEKIFGLPDVDVSYSLYGDPHDPVDNTPQNDLEWSLDTQAVLAMAPQVREEQLRFARANTLADLVATVTAWAEDPSPTTARTASVSWTLCGLPPTLGPAGQQLGIVDPSVQREFNDALERAVVEGRTLFAITGDTGGSCPVLPVNTNGLATNGDPDVPWPASSPWAVAVGGTTIIGDGADPQARAAEYAWEFGGGGVSTYQQAPTWQHGVAHITAPCVTDFDGKPALPSAQNLCRSLPDVSALAGDGLIGDGFPEVWNGLVFNTGGTSLAGPLWAGMWARVNAAAPRDADQVPSAGFAAPLIYRTAQTTPGAFYDVTVGDNQPYPALPGYDNATGWGPPNLTALMADVDHRTTPTDPEPTAPPAPPFVACGGGPLFVNPAHIAAVPEAGGRSVPAPQLSIVSGRMHGDGVTLSTTLTLTRLSSAVPAGAAEEDYEFSFFVGTHTYFTRAVVTALGTVSYFAGSVEEAPVGPERVPTDEVSGSFTPGADGTVTVRAPIRDFPGAAPGATLIAPSATTAVRPSTTGGVSLVVDTGGPGCDYRLGAVNAKVR